MDAPEATPRPSRRFRRKKPLVVAAVVLASLLAGSVAVSARGTDDAGYRTATAGTHEVDQVLDAVGTIEPVSQASVAFPVDGTVSTVDVEVGDTVTVGQQLASLDVEDLTTTLHEKQEALDQAELTLSLALAGEDVSAAAAGGTPSGGAVGRSAGAATSTALSAAQQEVLDAQQAVDAALVDAQAAYDAAAAVCTTADTATAETTATTETTATSDTAADLTACQTALAATLEAQQVVADAQDRLTEAADALTSLLADLADEESTTTTTTTPSDTTSGTGSGTGSAGSSGSGTPSSSADSGSSASGSTPSSSGSDTSTSSSPSAEDLIAYQKAVDAAALEVSVAEQAVDQATIVSPIGGTVVSVGLAVGDDATAASSTQTIVVVGEGGVEVTTSVSVTDLPDIEVGQQATVTPDGSSDELAGEIVRIGAAADTSSGSSTYSVTISLTGDTAELGNGSTASVEIVTDAAGEALAVPTSAVTLDGETATVQTVEDGKATTTKVEIGAVGASYTEITDGLDAGDEVVLADLSEPLPSAATSSSNGSSSSGAGGGGSFPGGGMGGPPSMGGN